MKARRAISALVSVTLLAAHSPVFAASTSAAPAGNPISQCLNSDQNALVLANGLLLPEGLSRSILNSLSGEFDQQALTLPSNRNPFARYPEYKNYLLDGIRPVVTSHAENVAFTVTPHLKRSVQATFTCAETDQLARFLSSKIGKDLLNTMAGASDPAATLSAMSANEKREYVTFSQSSLWQKYKNFGTKIPAIVGEHTSTINDQFMTTLRITIGQLAKDFAASHRNTK